MKTTMTFRCSAGGMWAVLLLSLVCLQLPAKVSGCFSENTKVQVLNKGMVSIKDVQVNDRVKSGVDVDYYQKVYALGRYQPDMEEATFLQIHLSGEESILEVTGDHLLYLMNRPGVPVPARTIQVGDVLMHEKVNDTVTKLQTVTKRGGLYAPLTPDGTLLVNDGVVASAYSTAQQAPGVEEMVEVAGTSLPISQAQIVHVALSPLRWWCTPSDSSSICTWQHPETGTNGYGHYVLKLVHWGEQQNTFVQWSLFFMGLVSFGLIHATEWVLAEWVLHNRLELLLLSAILLVYILVQWLGQAQVRKGSFL